VRIRLVGEPYLKDTEVTIGFFAPLSVQKVALPVETLPNWLEEPEREDTLWIAVEVQWDRGQVRERVPLRVVDKGQPFKVTFLSRIDHSAQYFAVLPPRDFDPRRSYALILTLHGAGVEAYGQVKAYGPKDWAFVVAPTNRRRFGFDWQDWGRLHTLQVLDIVTRRFPIDTNRIYLTGHSMGGHGTWHVGLHHPDRFAAIAPSAGWTSFQRYVPFFLQQSAIYAHPDLLAIRDRVLRADRTPLFVENALNLPAFVLQGGKDDNVPPTHARHFVGLLKRLGYKVQYLEVPGKGHWWDEEGVEGTACVDHPDLMEFLQGQVRDPFPRRIRFRTTDLGINPRCYWIEIVALDKLYQDGVVEAKIEGPHRIDLKLQNIAALRLYPPSKWISPGPLSLRINGQMLKVKWKGWEPIPLRRKKDGRYKIGRWPHKKLMKTPHFYGPIKQAFYSPFIFVYGTRGDRERRENSLHLARITSEQWWWRANGRVEIIPDTLVTPEVVKRYNLILFGGPGTNRILQRIQKKLPIRMDPGGVTIGRVRVPGRDLAVLFLYPNPLNPRRFVMIVGGNSKQGEKLAGVMGFFHSGAGVPDFLVYDASVRQKGWGGVRAAGFFDHYWRVQKELMFSW